MKIKEICQKTELTDRTVRYYIEEGLISPFYTENYLGRKSFDFSEEDLAKLKDIATLRAFGFSIEEIKELSWAQCDSARIIETVKRRTEECLEESRIRLNALAAIDACEGGGLSSLAEKLSAPGLGIENEGAKRRFGKSFISLIRSCAAFLAVWLPIISAIAVFLFKFCTVQTPIIHPVFVMLTLSCFLPSMATVLIFHKLKGSTKFLRILLISLCVLCLPLGIFFSTKSVTVCDHRYVAYSTSVQATCQSEGEMIMRCEDCGSFERQKVEKLAHIPTVVKGRAPTCTEAGFSDGSYCSACKTTLSNRTKISAKGHSYASQVIEQSCGVDGCVLYMCDCGDSYRTDVARATNIHDFEYDYSGMRYECRVCGLKAIAHGNVDGSLMGGNDRVKFYVTDSAPERTLVVYGSGDMPDFSEDYYPFWVDSYMYEVTTVIIESGITSIGDYAFSNHGGFDYYHSVTKFIIRSKEIRVGPDDRNMSGIKCDVTYDY
mgnify:CR=1 FL=1